MRLLQNITSEPMQRHTILFEDSEIVITLIYFPTIQRWTLSAEYKEFNIYGVQLSLGCTHMLASAQPFDFTVVDTSGQGIIPTRRDDFETGRCLLYLVEPNELAEIRGVEVAI